MTPGEVLRRLRAWARRGQLDRELAREMDAHVDLLTRDLEAEGLAPEVARAAARRQVGNVTGLRERSRDAWGFPALESVLHDVRYAIRGLAHAPGFAATVIVTLGLGIGANAAMFAVIDRLMFRPPAFLHDPPTVHTVYLQITLPNGVQTSSTMPYTRYLDLAQRTRSFSQLAATSEWRLAVGRGLETRVRKVAGVSASLFGFFDARPVRGRFFGESEDQVPLGALVAVISEAMWRTTFGARDMTGESLRIGSLDYTIIGVFPEGFTGTTSGGAPDVFVPVTTIPPNLRQSVDDYDTAYNWDWIVVVARRAAGVSAAAATADLSQAYRGSRAAQRATNPRVLADSVAHPRALAGPLKDAAGPDPGAESRVLLWVSGVALIVLLIACANVANLMLARVMHRRREIAVRLALGVSRARLVGQFVIESVLLATFGVLAGLLIAQWGGAAIRTLLLPQGSGFNLATDWRTISIAGLCALVAALLTTVAPAVLATRSDPAADLKAGTREGSYRHSPLRTALLVLQGTMSVVLLVGAGLFVRSLANVLDIRLGYDAAPVVEVITDLRGQELDDAGMIALRRRLLESAERIPGAVAVATANSQLFRTSTTTLRVAGIDSVARLGRFNVQIVTVGYFLVMQTRILRGRGFQETRPGGVPEVVVSQAMARVLWPGVDPIGQCMQVAWDNVPETLAPCTMVVGVAEDVAQQGITDEARFLYYLNADQMSAFFNARRFIVRMPGARIEADVERVRRAMQAAMPGDGFVVVRPLQEIVDDNRRSWRLGATLFVAFGGLALAVAAIGLYGAIGYGVTQRMHELAMRTALGAQRGHIMGLVMLQGLRVGAAVVVLGLVIAAAAAPFIEPLLYKESPHDPVVFVSVGALMMLVALVAGLPPARRALTADPNRVLRSD